ncbi:MAG: Adaptive-response sensory-kinase SasA [Gammaproteobacteria bacterium]|nr:Adaptive-response sensory-kinase SasA [Gammaproteobacteria bacterium]
MPGAPPEGTPAGTTQQDPGGYRARFEAALNAMVDGLIIIDQWGRIEVFNPAAERIFGYRAAEVIGRNVKMLMPEPWQGEHDRYLRNYLRTGVPRIIGIGREAQGLRKDGTVFPLDIAIGEARGERMQFVGIVRDISWRKNAEAAIRAREAELRLIIDNAPAGIFMADGLCRIRTVNPEFCRLCGRAQGVLLGMHFADLVAAEDRGIVDEMRQAAQRASQPDTQDVRIRRPDGGLTPCSLHCSYTVQDGQPLFVAQVLDRSSELMMEQQVREQRDRLAHVGRLSTMGEMASGIAHEITQPLTAIATYAQAARRMLARGAQGAQDFEEALEQIARQAERAGDIIQRLRGFMRREEIRSELVDINEQLRAVIRFADVDLRHHYTRVELALAPDLPPVQADAVQLQQVALNFIRNAVDAMAEVPPGERVIAIRSARGPGAAIEFSVTDRGPGVSPGDVERLFAPFFTTKAHGIGLGLSISGSIVAAFGGRTWYSEHEGGGAEFHVSLPVAQPVEHE